MKAYEINPTIETDEAVIAIDLHSQTLLQEYERISVRQGALTSDNRKALEVLKIKLKRLERVKTLVKSWGEEDTTIAAITQKNKIQ